MAEATTNSNPVVHAIAKTRRRDESESKEDRDGIDGLEVYELIRHLNDPEHPLTLEYLNVVNIEHIRVDDDKGRATIEFTPTIPHCSMATLIGLCIRVKLLRCLPPRFKTKVSIYPGSHASEKDINKQLNDKERVAAALENDQLMSVVERCIGGTDRPIDGEGSALGKLLAGDGESLL